MTQFTGAFPAPAWTPPAREPFMPLRPLTLGQVLAGAFRGLRHNPGVTLAPALVLSIAAALLSAGFGLVVVAPLVTATGSSALGGGSYGWVSGFAAGAFGWLMQRALLQGAGTLQQGVASVDVAHAVVGRRLTPGGLRRRTRGVRGPLVAWTAIVVVATLLGGALAIGVMGLLALGGPAVAVLGGFLVYPGAAVAAAWLGTRAAFIPSVLVVERLRFGPGVRRGWRLTRGCFWRTFGTRLLAWAMIWLATSLVGIPVTMLVGWLTGIVAGNGAAGDGMLLGRIGELLAAVVTAVVAALGLVVTTSADAVLYLDTRMRREGLDLELARFLERRRPIVRFDPSEPDPYAPPAELTAARVVAPAPPTTGPSWG